MLFNFEWQPFAELFLGGGGLGGLNVFFFIIYLSLIIFVDVFLCITALKLGGLFFHFSFCRPVFHVEYTMNTHPKLLTSEKAKK